MDKKEYLKNYRKYHYYKTRKIVTFPLLNNDYEVLKKQADKSEITVNKLSKEIVLSYIENNSINILTTEQKKYIQEYMRISRGIANNINQIAHNSNLGEYVDINILINSLKKYEDEFKNFILKNI